MNEKEFIRTERLILRQWRKEDLKPFAALNADPRVMECFFAMKSREESDQMVKRMAEYIEIKGWSFWAVSTIDANAFIGMIGLENIQMEFPFAPAVEIGWRLAYEHWGKGYATEGAKACLKYGFEKLKLKEIVAFTTAGNTRSRNVMEKIGMHRNPKDDFDHPHIPANHPLVRHVLYRIASSAPI